MTILQYIIIGWTIMTVIASLILFSELKDKDAQKQFEQHVWPYSIEFANKIAVIVIPFVAFFKWWQIIPLAIRNWFIGTIILFIIRRMRKALETKNFQQLAKYTKLLKTINKL